MANINSNKIEEINRGFSERKQNENPTNYEYYMETLKDLKNLNISDEYTLNQINTLLIKLSEANDFYTISEIMDELETIKEKFENDKLEIRDDSRNQRENIENEDPFANLDPFADKDPVNIVQSFEGNIEIDGKEINPVELLEYILDQDGTMIDFDGLKSIDSALEDAKNMSNEELASKIKSFDLYFDIEPKDWNVYFESRNIPPEKQDEYKQNFDLFKKMYKNLTTRNVDAGNFIFEDIGGKINKEAERISNLPEGKVTINISELKPEGQDLIFENKHDALMFLYYSKLLLNEVATIGVDILNAFLSIYGAGESIVSYFVKNPAHFFFTIFVWVSVSTTGTALRKINGFIIKREPFILSKFSKGVFLNESASGSTDPNVSQNAAELEKRKAKIEELKMLYADDPKMQKKIRELEYWTTVGDGKTSGGSGKGFSESTFWRKVKNIENGGIWSNKYTDTFGKLFLLNSEKISVGNNADFLKRNLLDSSGEIKKGSMLDNVRSYIQLGHNISDADERELVRVLKIYENKVKSGAVGDLKLSGGDLLGEFQKQILNSLNNVQSSSGEKFNFGFDIFRENKFISAADSEWLKSSKVDDILKQIELEGWNLDPDKKIQIRRFINHVKRNPSNNLYSTGTVADVINILMKNTTKMDFEEALKKSREWRVQADIDNIKSIDLIDALHFLKDNSSLYPTNRPTPKRLRELRIKKALDYDTKLKAIIEESELSLTEKKGLINQINDVLDKVKDPNNTSSTAKLYNTFIKNNKELFDQIKVNGEAVNNVKKLFPISINDANEILSKKGYTKAIKEIGFSLGELKNAYWTNVSYLEKIPTRNQDKKQFRKHRNRALATVEYLHMKGQLQGDYDLLTKGITGTKNINELTTFLNGKVTIMDENQLKSDLRNYNNSINIERIKSMGIDLDNDLKIISPDVINEKGLSVEGDRSVLKILRLITKGI
ncbi:hypothetical protein BLD25_02940 [Candidatus Gracilibacteria bacterium GN02-872]|nr:hypothetical protein BLD25_02940 [Candidatus Gracilibacteria bacterium GN02-872]